MSLESFVPVPVPVAVGGHRIEILPLRVRQIAAFSKAIAPAMPMILADDLPGAVVGHADAVRDACCVATGLDPDEIDGLFADDFMELVATVYTVNLDFFHQRVLPVLRATQERIVAARALHGERSSPGSDATDTGSTTV